MKIDQNHQFDDSCQLLSILIDARLHLQPPQRDFSSFPTLSRAVPTPHAQRCQRMGLGRHQKRI